MSVLLLLVVLASGAWLYFSHSTTVERRIAAAWMFALVGLIGWPHPIAMLGAGLWISTALELTRQRRQLKADLKRVWADADRSEPNTEER